TLYPPPSANRGPPEFLRIARERTQARRIRGSRPLAALRIFPTSQPVNSVRSSFSNGDDDEEPRRSEATSAKVGRHGLQDRARKTPATRPGRGLKLCYIERS